MKRLDIIEYEIWRKSLPMTLRNALAPSDMANMFLAEHSESNKKDLSRIRFFTSLTVFILLCISLFIVVYF